MLFKINDHVFTNMGDDGVAFFLVVIEKEPERAVVVVGSGDVADVTVRLGIVHDALVPVFLLLQVALCR